MTADQRLSHGVCFQIFNLDGRRWRSLGSGQHITIGGDMYDGRNQRRAAQPRPQQGFLPLAADGNLRESRSVIDTDEIELEREWAGLDEGLYLFATDLWRLEGTASS